MSNSQQQFYLTLPSNSSMDYFPNNTVTHYTTHLPKQIRLEGDGQWEMALVEAHYPCSLMTVGNDEWIWIKLEGFIVRPAVLRSALEPIKVTPGYYRNIDDLLKEINSLEMIHSCLELVHDKELDRVKVTRKLTTVVSVHFSHSLSLQLGFDPQQQDLLNNPVGLWSPSLSMGLSTHMYVYCDLVEPQLIGDTTAPLLKIVNIDRDTYVHGAHKTVHYTSPHYMPVMKGTFETIEIDLRDDTGKKLPFIFGTSYVKLHFKRAQQQQLKQ